MTARRPIRRRREDPFAWLDLVITDGPFLSRPALRSAFGQGLPRPDATVDTVADTFATEFGPWEKAWTAFARRGDDDAARRRYLRVRDAWVEIMVRDILRWGTYYTTDDPSGTLTAASLDGRVTLSPTGVLTAAGTRYALLLVVDPTEDLTAPGTDGWSASPVDRAAALLSASSTAEAPVPVAVVTDGRWWSLVWTSPTGAVGSGTFDGALFREEPDLRDAFWALARLTSLAGGTRTESLSALLEASIATAEEITEALGAQVRSAVELLVQAFSAAHLHARRSGTPSPLPAEGHEVYDAAVTVMMRVVFLLFAEANELLPTEELFRQAYAISDVGDRLDERRRNATGIEGDEALAATSDTWHRLLATSRALYEGATFEDLRMPAYGGSLFDPDRYAWLTATDPVGGLRVRIDDLVMFHVLRAVQHARIGGEDRQISFRELDVEQIGYVYEGLLGYTARYTGAEEVVVGLQGPEPGSEPEIPLTVLHELAEEVDENADAFATHVLAWTKEKQSGAKARTRLQIAKAYTESGADAVWDEARRRLRPVVEDEDLVEELAGYYLLMRRDLRDLPYVVPGGGLVVEETRSRATSGTHYTPRSLAEDVVHHALEPLVYDPGPLQTADTTAWVPVSSAQLLDLKVADIACGSGAFLVAAARYLGRALLAAWDREGLATTDTDAAARHRREIEARREVIARCLYGADINPMAVEMCKLSLWLVSLDPDKPFSFVDDKILTGNSLLGLTTLKQLRGLHIDPSPQRFADPGFTVDIEAAIDKAKELRRLLATPVADGDTMRSTRTKRALLAQLDSNNEVLRTVADAIVAAGLPSGGKPGRQLDAEYEALSLALLKAYPPQGEGDRRDLDRILERGLTPTVPTDYHRWQPLHWAVELPDVMLDHGGFDAIVGNPPFLGGKKISPAMGQNVRLWLVYQLAGGTAGNADLVAYFFLRAMSLLRPLWGQIGLIATNTIGQGDTREVGLDQMTTSGFTIRRAIQSSRWPASSANLEYAAVWGTLRAPMYGVLSVSDGIEVPRISTLLEPEGRVTGRPLRLPENRSVAYIGSYVLGNGFILRPDEAAALIARGPRNAEVLRPYLNGEDLNSRPDASPSRWIVNFGERTEAEARGYPEPWSIVERRVRPQRITKDAARYPRMVYEWWKYWNARPGLYSAIAQLDEVLVITRHSSAVMPLRVSSDGVFSDATVVFASDSFALQAALSSAAAQLWAIRNGSTIGAGIRYTPSDVFETFPRPAPTSDVEALGQVMDEERRDIMLSRNLGLTKLYNLVNDPDVQGDRQVDRIREIHVALDEGVVAAYGWEDVPLDHGFHTYRQMERFTISPAARVELLDRLLEENHRRAAAQGGDVSAPADDGEDSEIQGEDA